MTKKLLLFSLLCLSICYVFANYATPGTGVKWNLDDLVANSGGKVTFVSGSYQVNDTVFISQLDTLFISSNATVKFAPATYLDVNGTLIINPPTNVTFTAVDPVTGFHGVRIDSSAASSIRKLTFEYASAFRLTDCSPRFDSCIFQYNTITTTFSNAAISLFRSSPVITYCSFLNNQRAAIQGGSNIANAPKIYNCLFMGNNVSNQNVPQINLGSSGTDTVRIMNSQILRASTNSGGIGFLPIGTVNAVISGNIIRNNRYGITFNGGSNINSLVSYNVIDSNNTQNNPNLGGSGIAFTGGNTTSHQNSIVTGNIFRFNLWGITIQNGSKPTLGNLENSDTSDNGKNYFINNTNATTPGIDVYNNSPDNIMAQGNSWGSDDPAVIEQRIFHQPDNGALGLVNYAGYIMPVALTKLSASVFNRDITLYWQTASEQNSRGFEIEKSMDGNSFINIGFIANSGNSTSLKQYQFADKNIPTGITTLFYRLKIVDKDGRFSYSAIVPVRMNNIPGTIKIYPSVLSHTEPVYVELDNQALCQIKIAVLNNAGQIISSSAFLLQGGRQTVMLDGAQFQKGINTIQVSGKDFSYTKQLIRF